MRDTAVLAREKGVRLHTHLCETLDEERYTLQRHGLRPVEFMETLDWVGDDVWYAHAIHVNDREIDLFAHRGTGVCHCPSSNMRLASGIAPVRKYLNAGVRTGLGVDGSEVADDVAPAPDAAVSSDAARTDDVASARSVSSATAAASAALSTPVALAQASAASYDVRRS